MRVIELSPIDEAEAKPLAKCKQLSPTEKERLFKQYIVPYFGDIKSLTKRYTDNYQDVEDNYYCCLAQLYNYVGSYNPSQKLMTWIHICVKRACFKQNKKRAEEASHFTDMEMCSQEELHQNGNSMVADAGFGCLVDNLSDEMLAALTQIPPLRLSPFMQFVQGVQLREIVEVEWKLGHLEKRSENMVRSRIYWARKQLQYLLEKNGIKRNYRKSEVYDRDPDTEDF